MPVTEHLVTGVRVETHCAVSLCLLQFVCVYVCMFIYKALFAYFRGRESTYELGGGTEGEGQAKILTILPQQP